MKRFALALAAALLGTGCISSNTTTYVPPPCNPSATIDWRYQGGSSGGFVDYTNTLLTTCGSAGVSTVEVYANGTQVGVFGCAAAPQTVALASGANDVIVEALDAPSASGGTILYRDRFAINAATCGSQGTFVAQPGEGLVSVSYSFSPVNACYSPGPSFIWVLVHDDIAGVVAADSASAPEANDTCGVDFPITLRLAAGSYTLRSTEEVIRGAAANTYLAVGKNCTPAALGVTTGATTPINPVLADTTTFCP